jgi:hypothetical protein
MRRSGQCPGVERSRKFRPILASRIAATLRRSPGRSILVPESGVFRTARAPSRRPVKPTTWAPAKAGDFGTNRPGPQPPIPRLLCHLKRTGEVPQGRLDPLLNERALEDRSWLGLSLMETSFEHGGDTGQPSLP